MLERRASCAAVAAAALLLGCANGLAPTEAHRPALPAGMPFERPVGVTTVPQLTIDRWWTAFDDVHLHARISAALAQNTDLAVAAARLRAARAQLDEATGAQQPQLDIEARGGRSRASAEASGLSHARTGASHRVSLTAGHEIDLWGKLANGTQAARERLQAETWARASIEWSLTAQVAEAHFALRAVTRQLEIARAVRQGRMREVELRRTQVRAGAGSELDLRRAEAELAVAEAADASLSRRSLALQGTLALLTGMPPEAVLRPSEPATQPLEPDRAFEVRLPEGSLSQWLIQRPDVREAEAQLLASKADVAAARAATFPAVRLTGSLGSDVRELSSLFSGPGFAWSVAAGAVQSVFDGGRARARVRQSEALSDVALARYQRAVASAVIDVREAYLSFEFDAQALRAEQQRVASLAQALELARIGQEAGVSSQLDTLDAQRHHFQAQLAEVDAYRARLIGQVAAFKALGGGHSADVTLSHENAPTGAPR